jgi:hypothetical protein
MVTLPAMKSSALAALLTRLIEPPWSPCRCRPSPAFDDLDRLHVERLVGHAAKVAQAVDLDIGTGFEAADERPVAQWRAARLRPG